MYGFKFSNGNWSKGIVFYQKYGFTTVINKENYYSNGENALYMVKEVIA